jgi:hypothetical protein
MNLLEASTMIAAQLGVPTPALHRLQTSLNSLGYSYTAMHAKMLVPACTVIGGKCIEALPNATVFVTAYFG